MIFGAEYTKEVKLRLTLGMKAGLAAVVIGTTSLLLENKINTLPFDLKEATNYIGGIALVWGALKFQAGFATLPKEPEEYMLTDAKRFRREGITEILLSLSSLVINNKDNIINLLK